MAEGWRSQYLGMAPESTSEANYSKCLANYDRSGEAAASRSGRSVWLQELRSFATCKTHLALASMASPALAISLTHDDKLQNVFGLLPAWICKVYAIFLFSFNRATSLLFSPWSNIAPDLNEYTCVGPTTSFQTGAFPLSRFVNLLRTLTFCKSY